MPNTITITLDHGQVKLAIGEDFKALATKMLVLLVLPTNPKPEWRDMFDYLLGALYELACAEALGYKNRQQPYDPTKYDLESLFPRVNDMGIGWLRIDGKWAAGLHFKSALMRMDAVHDRAEALFGIKKKKGGRKRRTAGQPAPWCGKPEEHKCLAKVFWDVAQFKHEPSGTSAGHQSSFEEAVTAFGELVELLG